MFRTYRPIFSGSILYILDAFDLLGEAAIRLKDVKFLILNQRIMPFLTLKSNIRTPLIVLLAWALTTNNLSDMKAQKSTDHPKALLLTAFGTSIPKAYASYEGMAEKFAEA